MDKLIGKKITHSWTENTFPEGWPTPTYVTVICDAKKLIWNNVTDMDNFSYGEEEYTAIELAPNIIQVSWKESPETTNYGIIWTLDLNTNKIKGVLVNIDSRVNYVVSGTFTIEDDIEVEKPLVGCS